MTYTFSDGMLSGPKVQHKPTPNKNANGSCKPEIIVIHDTASSLNTMGVVNWLCNPDANVSANFVIGRDGEIWQLGRPTEKCWHTGKSKYEGFNVGGTCNSFAVGIEIVNPGWLIDGKDGYAYHSASRSLKWPVSEVVKKDDENHTEKGRYWLPYTQEQIDAVKALCEALVQSYPNIHDIVPHWQISPGRKQDTNPLYPLHELRLAVFPDYDNEEDEEVTPAKEPIAASAEDEENYTHFTIGRVNLRSGPSTNDKILGVLPKDFWFTPDQAMSKTINGILWYAFDVDTLDDVENKQYTDVVTGYVSSAYVKKA